MRISFILYLLLNLGCQLAIAQDTVSVKEIYFDTNLAYQYSNDALFNGVVQKVRKNGHLVYEEFYEQGAILEYREYYNFANKKLAEKVLYYKEYPLTWKEKIRYTSNKNGKFTKHTFYNIEQSKILITTYQDTTLIYKCSYKNNKKNGKEFCYDDNNNPIVTEFINGKKVKD